MSDERCFVSEPVSMIPAEPGWRAVLLFKDGTEEAAPLVAWAICSERYGTWSGDFTEFEYERSLNQESRVLEPVIVFDNRPVVLNGEEFKDVRARISYLLEPGEAWTAPNPGE